ncbi:MAG: hypothetical protein ACYT04_000000100000, partial [Nostoc sp.]
LKLSLASGWYRYAKIKTELTIQNSKFKIKDIFRRTRVRTHQKRSAFSQGETRSAMRGWRSLWQLLLILTPTETGATYRGRGLKPFDLR